MTVALIATNPKAIVAVYVDAPNPLTLPNGDKVNGADVGWTSRDGAYALVAVAPFAPPGGSVVTGSPTYAVAQDGTVTETYATKSAPLNVIPFAQFIGRWTTAEYALLMQKRATAITAGTAGSMALVIQWDQTMAIGSVDLNAPAAQNFKAALVTASILTQTRADAIFA